MALIKHEMWTRENGDKFVILTLKEFRRLEDLAEDKGLSRIMRDSKRRQADAPRIPWAQAKRELGLARTRKRAKA